MPEAKETNGVPQLLINICCTIKYNQLIEIMEVFNELRGKREGKSEKKEIRPPQEVEQADGSQKGVECIIPCV
jgi:hypothetical protein